MITYDDILHVARRLPLAERLASALLGEAAGEVRRQSARRSMTLEAAYAALDAIRAHFAAQGPVSPTIAEDLLASRR